MCYQNMQMPDYDERPWKGDFIETFDLKTNYSYVGLAWGPRELALPLVPLARWLLSNNHSFLAVGPASARADFEAFGVRYRTVEDPASDAVVARLRGASGLLDRARAGEPYYENGGEPLARLGDAWLKACEDENADHVVGYALPWTMDVVASIGQKIGKPVSLVVPYPGTMAAYEHVVDPWAGAETFTDLGKWSNYAVARASNLISGFLQRSSINAWRARLGLPAFWFAEALDYQVFRYLPTYFSWSPIFYNLPNQDFYRFTALFTDWTLHDHQKAITDDERKWGSPYVDVKQVEGDPELRQDLAAWLDARPDDAERANRTAKVAYVDLGHADQAEAAALAASLAAAGYSVVAHPASSAPALAALRSAGFAGDRLLVLSRLEGFDLEALLPRVSLAVHHGDSYLLSQAIRAGTPSLILSNWVRAFDAIAPKFSVAVALTRHADRTSQASVAAAIAAATAGGPIREALDTLASKMRTDWGVSLFTRTTYDCFSRILGLQDRKDHRQYLIDTYGSENPGIFEAV